MSNDPNNTHSFNSLHPAVQITQMVLQTVTMLFMFYLTFQANKNTDKIDRVEQRQEQVADRTAEVKKTVEEATPTAQSREIQLWGNWKWLETVYEGSGRTEDKVKAIQAKRVYDEFKNQKRD